MKKGPIVTFGELLLRFSKDDHLRLTQGRRLNGDYGGSEANVAVSLATLGDHVEYVTRLPSSTVGRAAALTLSQYGVGTGNVLYGDGRMGCYYFEASAGMRNSLVSYDRANSAYYALKPGMIDWHRILRDASVLHVSGITAAISQDAADATMEALDVADELGLTVSFDINYRKNLWQYGANPRETLSRMLSRCDLMFGDVIEFEFISQRKAPLFDARDNSYEMNAELYRDWFEDMQRQFPRCKRWLMGMRNQISSSHHVLTALLWADQTLYKTRVYDIDCVVDPMGVGDAFMAAMLHAEMADLGSNQQKLDYALAAATLKNSVPGDFNLTTDAEIRWLLDSGYQPALKVTI